MRPICCFQDWQIFQSALNAKVLSFCQHQASRPRSPNTELANRCVHRTQTRELNCRRLNLLEQTDAASRCRYRSHRLPLLCACVRLLTHSFILQQQRKREPPRFWDVSDTHVSLMPLLSFICLAYFQPLAIHNPLHTSHPWDMTEKV
jgi:hypothetical protein